jgi:hypothetical protein
MDLKSSRTIAQAPSPVDKSPDPAIPSEPELPSIISHLHQFALIRVFFFQSLIKYAVSH